MADKDAKKKQSVLDMSKCAPLVRRPRRCSWAYLGVPFGVGPQSASWSTSAVMPQARRPVDADDFPRRYMDKSVRVKFMGGREVLQLVHCPSTRHRPAARKSCASRGPRLRRAARTRDGTASALPYALAPPADYPYAAVPSRPGGRRAQGL